MNKSWSIPILLAGLWTATASAQQIIPPSRKEFLDSTFAVLPSATGARYRRETIYTDSVGGTVRDYFLNGKLQSSGAFDHIRKGVANGTHEFWYDSGQLQCHSEFEHGKQNGEFRLYYPGGQLKRRERYVADARTAGECFRADGTTLPYFEYQQLPTYPEGDGGKRAVVAAVARGVVYPKDALRENRTGRVLVTFTVTNTGQVVNVRVTESVFPSIDAAAVQAVQELRRFVPGRLDGEAVAVSYTVPITFKISDSRRSIFEKRTTYELPKQ